ncbi:hypothetical protein BDZ91DRAFT_804449 [Kalaharituber pfeilii]|nr:hypothetical protein BDZ91DRAFT_804449 [Kalaharituber pfeilii]
MTAEQGRLLMTGEGHPYHAHRAATGYTSQISEGRSSHEQTAIAVIPAEDGTALESIPEDRPTLVSIDRRVRNQMTQDSFISSARVRTHLRLNQDPDAVTQHPVGLGELQRSNNNPDKHQHEGPPRKQHKSSRGGPLPPSQSGKPYPSNGSEPCARSSQTCSRSSQSILNSLMGAKKNKDDVEEDDAAYDEDYHTCHKGILGKPTEVIPAVVLEGNWNASDSDDTPRSWRRSGACGRSRRAATPMRRSTHICGSNSILNKVRRERGEEKEDKICEERDGNEANGTAGAEEEDEDEQDEGYEEDEKDEEDNDDGQNDESDEEGGR